MKKLKVLTVIFDTEIELKEISGFRSAVIEQAGRENKIFHNHLSDNKFIYRYPLIQYKRIGRSPALVCVGEGTDNIYHFFENKGQYVIINGKEHELKLKKLYMNEFTMQVWDKKFNYSLKNWLPFNENNFHTYRNLTSESEQNELMQNILKANILSFAKGIDWHVEREIETNILKILYTKAVKYKEAMLVSINIEFKTNVFLPSYIGLGKGVSKGFGMVQSKMKRELTNENQEI